MRKLILPALALFLVAGVASAAEGSVNVQVSRPALHSEDSTQVEWHDGMSASTTMNMRHGTSSPEMRHATSTPDHKVKPMPVIGVPGTILSLGANSFTMNIPAGKDHATTTVTVNVSSTTVYSNASSTAAFSNLAVGSHVVVLGKVSTSTNSVAATRVILTGAFPKGDTEDKQEMKANFGGIISHLKELFGKHASSTINVNASSTSAAAVQGGFIKSILHALFGWM